MSVTFGNYRLTAYVFIILLSATVLGLSAEFAAIFLPNINHDLTIMALVCSSLTIFVFLLLFQWSQPQIEVVALPVLGIFWLAVGCVAADMIGDVQCYPLGNDTTPTKNGHTSARAFCYKMKVIEAFSIAIFVLFMLFFVLLVTLTSRAVTLGNRRAWRDPINELPWFGESFYGGSYNGYTQPVYYPPGAIQQQQGQSLIIQPGHHGQPTTVQTVPM